VSVYKKSCRSVKRMLRYSDYSIFQDGGCPILDIWNFKIVMVEKFKRAKLCHCTKFRADRSNGCGGMSIFDFQDGGRRHLGFSNYGDFNCQNAQEGQTGSLCQISLKSVKLQSRYGDFSIFQYGGRRHLGF